VDKSDLSVVLLTGGTSRRMGTDKAQLEFGTDTLLMFQLAQIPRGISVIVVGETQETVREVDFTRESPAGSGPVAAIAAGLDRVKSTEVALLAVDTPFAATHVLELELPIGSDAVIPQDQGGKPQFLAGVYRSKSLRTAMARLGSPAGKSMRELVAEIPEIEYVQLTQANAEFFLDIDTPEDLATARELLGKRPKVGP
jgi:molybdenum cofactor guanylyltransferase